MRKNIWGFAGLMVMLMFVTPEELVTRDHELGDVRPTLLVSNVQPRLVGQRKLSVLPDTETCITGGLVFTSTGTVNAVMEPSVDRLFCQVAPAPVTVAKPLTGPLKR